MSYSRIDSSTEYLISLPEIVTISPQFLSARSNLQHCLAVFAPCSVYVTVRSNCEDPSVAYVLRELVDTETSRYMEL
jgi:hypothetical protein